jgi:hypothetical protein
MGGQARERAVTRSRLLGATSDVTVQGSGVTGTWKRFADSAPEVDGTSARLAGQAPELICKAPEFLCTTSDQAMRVCDCLRPSSEFTVRDPCLLVTTREFARTDSGILVKGSEQPVHSSGSVSTPAGLA